MATAIKTVEEYNLNEEVEPWTPTDLQIDQDREEALMHKMKKVMKEFETSQFYHDFRNEVQSPPISEHIQKVLSLESKTKMVIQRFLGLESKMNMEVQRLFGSKSKMNMAIQKFLGSESKMNMVIYGIGNIESDEYDDPKLQLSLAMLMRKDFDWIGDIEVFDPVLSTTEIRVLESLGCSVLSFNEKGRRQSLKPTMFFMPHCHIMLYNNLLQANWKPNLLSNTVIFGNSFDSYIKDAPFFAEDNLGIWPQMGHILAAQTFTNEFKMRTICYYSDVIDDEDEDDDEDASLQRQCEDSFIESSWHFFDRPCNKTWMQLKRESTKLKLTLEDQRGPVLPMAIVLRSYDVYFSAKRRNLFRRKWLCPDRILNPAVI